MKSLKWLFTDSFSVNEGDVARVLWLSFFV